MAMGDLDQLAASGSRAANAGVMFAVAPGMPILDAKGRIIGHVQLVKQSGAGLVQPKWKPHGRVARGQFREYGRLPYHWKEQSRN